MKKSVKYGLYFVVGLVAVLLLTPVRDKIAISCM